MRRRGSMGLLVVAVLALACDALPARGAAIAEALVDADEPFLRSRAALVRGKYARMAMDLYSFYRGTVPVYRADFRDTSQRVGVTRFPVDVLPLGIGDAHPENFGLLRGADGVLALEPNDLDSADRYPYHWDLRRLSTGMVLAARLSSPADPAARAAAIAAERDIARAVASAYADAIERHAGGAPGERVTSGGDAPLTTDLFRRGLRDDTARAELGNLTVFELGVRRLRRGVLDPEDPQEALHDLPAWAIDAIPAALAEHARTLPVARDPSFFAILDAARQVGSGVASWPRVRVVVLVRGESDDPMDDEILELKEALDSGAEGWLPPGTYADDVAARIRDTTRFAWARADSEPLWGAAWWLGVPVQIRRESEAHKTLRVERIEDDAGTPAALVALARQLATILARVHAAPVPGAEGAAVAIDRAIRRDRAAFEEDEVAVAIAYADRVEADWELFRDALRRLGPTLGMRDDDRDRPSADVRALFGAPEPVAPWE